MAVQYSKPSSACVPSLGSTESRLIQLNVEKENVVDHIHSQHLLYCQTGRLTIEEVKVAINWYIRQILNLISRDFPSEKNLKSHFAVNMPTNKRGIPMGFVYVYVVDTRVVNVIWGSNPDGSVRQKIDIIETDVDYSSAWHSGSSSSGSMSWADIMEEELRKEVVTVLPPLIGSLIVSYGYGGTEEVDMNPLPCRYMKERLLDINPCCMFSSAPINSSDWLRQDTAQIQRVFAKYDLEGNTGEWPKVVVKKGVNDNLKFYVTFSPNMKNEVVFINMLVLKTDFVKQDIRGNKTSTTLIFNMAKKTKYT